MSDHVRSDPWFSFRGRFKTDSETERKLMKTHEIIRNEWEKIFATMMDTPGYRRVRDGSLTIAHYKSVLKQIYFSTRENPSLQAMATAYFRGHQRTITGKFMKHALQEVGHDQLAVNDLKALGEDVGVLQFQKPLPATTALISYAFYQIQHQNPMGYLGYIYHLEAMPTKAGRSYMDSLKQIGVPDSALTFIEEHATVDIAHNKLMDSYIEEMITTQEDLEAFVYGMKVCANLYAKMVEDAFKEADEKFPSFDVAAEEVRATFGTSASIVLQSLRSAKSVIALAS